MSRAALRRVKSWLHESWPDHEEVWLGGFSAITLADLRAVVAMAERAAGLEDAMGCEIATHATKRKAAKR